jgi:formate hydrogenlyase subunit 3/multisubunit Na+/H+ antiporter MnhD subunit
MTIASFVLVAFEHHREEVSRASLVYLVTSHVGTAFLFLLFTLLAARAGSFDFAAFRGLELSPRWASACFVAALVGFGTKAGLWPLHAWLPQAHPAAPSHVSAVMSGVMIEIGLYGLVRTLGFLGTPAPWWGPLLLVVGAASALLGVLGALGAADLKRLLAYSSIENVGIVTLAIGLGLVLGRAGSASLAALAFSAALFHVWNHALFKSVLFQGAGAVLHAAHTRDLDGLGGLARRMPRVAAPFLAAALAASAVPPLNGFASEWVLYVTAFQSAIGGVGSGASLAILPLLALVGGLAAAAFVRAFGIAFLGEPRSAAARTATDAPPLLALPMWIGAILCLACGIAPGFFFRVAASAALEIVPAAGPLPMVAGLTEIGGALAVLAVIVAAVALFRAALLRDRAPRRALTWNCGYALPTARMQYTASSFAEPALDPFAPLLRSHIAAAHPEGYFPLEARYEEHVEEGGAGFAARLAQATAGALSRVTVLQLGRLQFYLLYILLTLLSLLAWWMPR